LSTINNLINNLEDPKQLREILIHKALTKLIENNHILILWGNVVQKSLKSSLAQEVKNAKKIQKQIDFFLNHSEKFAHHPIFKSCCKLSIQLNIALFEQNKNFALLNEINGKIVAKIIELQGTIPATPTKAQRKKS
jgi:hypothetical protein